MGFKIVSDVLLTKNELLRAVRAAQLDQMAEAEQEQQENLRTVNLSTQNDSDEGTQYYVRLVEEDPFEYVVFTIDEVMQLLRAKNRYNGTRAALCKLLRHAKVPFADDDQDEDDEDDDDDDDDDNDD